MLEEKEIKCILCNEKISIIDNEQTYECMLCGAKPLCGDCVIHPNRFKNYLICIDCFEK